MGTPLSNPKPGRSYIIYQILYYLLKIITKNKKYYVIKYSLLRMELIKPVGIDVLLY